MKHIIYIMGVSGSGKTTIGELLSQKTGIPFFDGDDFHSLANKEKMKAGEPLNDDDRKEWLEELNRLAVEQAKLKGAIIACSALKEKYRNVLVEGISEPKWVFLQGSYEEIYQRLEKRTGHYMPSRLLRSQFESLEVPVSALSINIENSPETIVAIISLHLNIHR
jgi:carbohydrate kinase (thermoresistant glucokinase family)